MSMSYYPLEGIGLVMDEKLVSYCLNKVVEGSMEVKDFNNSFSDLYSALETCHIKIEDIKKISENEMKELIGLILSDIECEDDYILIGSENYGYVYPYNKEKDSFDWCKDILGNDSLIIIRLGYRCGLFSKPFENINDLKKEINNNCLIPDDYDVLNNIVYYSAVLFG